VLTDDGLAPEFDIRRCQEEATLQRNRALVISGGGLIVGGIFLGVGLGRTKRRR
jgi:hypothetical protein